MLNLNALNGGFHVNIRPLQRDTHSARSTCAAGALGSDPLALMNLTLSDYKAPDSPCLLHVPVFIRLEGRDRGSRYHFEKLSFIWVQGAQVKMPFLQHALDSQLESLVVEQVVPALLDQGFFYVDHFLGDIAGHMVLGQVKRMHNSGLLNDGQLARRSNGVCRRSIRGDKITWVNGTERGTEAVNFLLTLIDQLISLCVGQLGKSIRARSKVSRSKCCKTFKNGLYLNELVKLFFKAQLITLRTWYNSYQIINVRVLKLCFC